VAKTLAWRRHIHPQDFVWLVLFAALIAFSPERSPIVITLLIAIGAVQVLEPRIGAKTSIVLNLALCYPLIYFSQPLPVGSDSYGALGISSGFWVILFLPVISAATHFGLLGGAIVGLFALSWFVSTAIYKLRRYDELELAADGVRIDEVAGRKRGSDRLVLGGGID